MKAINWAGWLAKIFFAIAIIFKYLAYFTDYTEQIQSTTNQFAPSFVSSDIEESFSSLWGGTSSAGGVSNGFRGHGKSGSQLRMGTSRLSQNTDDGLNHGAAHRKYQLGKLRRARRLDMLIILNSECMSAWPVHMALHEQEWLWRYFLEQAAHPRGHHLLDSQQQHHLILLLVLFWVLMMAKHCAIE
jgi:hypothetical protein